MFVCLLLLIAMVVVGVAFEGVLSDTLGHVVGDPDEPGNMFQFQLVLSGIWLVVRGLGSFVYFGLSELLTQGQTVGKRSAKIRVVKSDGFSLNTVSVFMRNIFRVVDQLLPLWFVPVNSPGHQLFGDMVAGTAVVVDEIKQRHSFRKVLGARSPADSRFRFDARMLERARPGDTEAAEQLLERWAELSESQLQDLSGRIIPALADRLQSEPPAEADYRHYLEDFVVTEYRRENRKLG